MDADRQSAPDFDPMPRTKSESKGSTAGSLVSATHAVLPASLRVGGCEDEAAEKPGTHGVSLDFVSPWGPSLAFRFRRCHHRERWPASVGRSPQVSRGTTPRFQDDRSFVSHPHMTRDGAVLVRVGDEATSPTGGRRRRVANI